MDTPYPVTCNPLTDTHCEVLDQAAQACAIQDELIGKCQAAGLPGIDGYVRDNNRRKQLIAGIKGAFFPERP